MPLRDISKPRNSRDGDQPVSPPTIPHQGRTTRSQPGPLLGRSIINDGKHGKPALIPFVRSQSYNPDYFLVPDTPAATSTGNTIFTISDLGLNPRQSHQPVNHSGPSDSHQNTGPSKLE